MALLDRHLGFVTALREAGLLVSVSESLDAVSAVGHIDLAERETLREAYAATLVKRQQHRDAFDTIFDIYFPTAVGDGLAHQLAAEDAEDDDGADGAITEAGDEAPAPGLADAWQQPVDANALRDFREELSDALLAGDETDLGALVQEAVARFGQIQGRRPGSVPGQQSWSRLNVMQRVQPQTLMSGLLAAMLGVGQDRDGLAEQVARTTLRARIARFERMVDAEVRRRVAEELGEERIARSAVRPPLERIDFLSANKDDLAALRREIYPLSRRLATRLVQEQRHGRSGQLDFRRTIRESMQTGGVPMMTMHKPRRPHRTDLVLLCDVSGSVRQFAQFTILLMFALKEQFGRVRAFAFVDDIDEVTDYLQPGQGIGESVMQLTQQARVTWVTGRTHYGRAFEKFVERYPDAVGPKTSLLVLGDARSNYGYLSEEVLAGLADEARHAYWLNPERENLWGTGDSAAFTYRRIVPMVEVRNLSQLSEFVHDLA
ncbi:MAG: VWA domain-containing protein [Micrococcales bacterium]|nr:VWA domain-containing protein [Micrococcales bacterium]